MIGSLEKPVQKKGIIPGLNKFFLVLKVYLGRLLISN